MTSGTFKQKTLIVVNVAKFILFRNKHDLVPGNETGWHSEEELLSHFSILGISEKGSF